MEKHYKIQLRKNKMDLNNLQIQRETTLQAKETSSYSIA